MTRVDGLTLFQLVFIVRMRYQSTFFIICNGRGYLQPCVSCEKYKSYYPVDKLLGSANVFISICTLHRYELRVHIFLFIVRTNATIGPDTLAAVAVVAAVVLVAAIALAVFYKVKRLRIQDADIKGSYIMHGHSHHHYLELQSSSLLGLFVSVLALHPQTNGGSLPATSAATC